jgi:pimeloyl-ACP methyl ester carboxylesterase
MNQNLSILRLFLMGTILTNLIGANSGLLSSPRMNQASPQEEVKIPEISTPKIEQMIDVGGRKLDCCVYGKRSPTVVLVSGLETPQVYWNPVVPELAAKATVVTYDRAGVGKSEIGDLPAHGEQSAKDLHVLLTKLAVPKPYILVGHSLGGMIGRLFASMYPDDVGGLILEDTQHEDNLVELRKILRGKDLEAFDQLMADRFNPPENPKTEADYRDVTREQLRKSRPLPRIPFVILTSAGRAKAMGPMFSDEAIEEMAKLDAVLNDRLAALIPGGRQIIIEGTGHNIHVDKPEALIVPVVEMINRVRDKNARPGTG